MAVDDQRMEVVNNTKTFNIVHEQYLRAIAQILLSVSLFCIIFFHSSSSSSSSRFCFLLRSLNFYISAIPLHSLDKRWVFLICNGILAIVANTSGLVNFPFFSSSSSSSSAGFEQQNHERRTGHEDYYPHDLHIVQYPHVQVLLLKNADQQQAKNALNEEDDHLHLEEEEFEDKLCITATEEEGGDQEIRIDISGDDYHDDENESFDYDDEFDPVEEDHHQEEGVVLEKLSTEELNKKFEDFIRKMKEELRIEAQEQHHMVVVKS